MDSRIDLDLLDRYLAGACTTQERDEVERWLATDPKRSVAGFKAGVSHERLSVLGDPRVVWQRVSRRIHTLVTLRRSVSNPRPLRRMVWKSIPALAVILSVTFLAWNAGIRPRAGHDAATASVYTTGNGQRANITLPDGSTIALNVASRLVVPADYANGHHVVSLSGAGLVTVSHHSGTPFTVVAGPATTQVLGTRFLVRHYANDLATTVAVQDGKVVVRSRAQSLLLSAAQQTLIDGHSAAKIRTADAAQFSFASGVLTFKNAPFPSAIADLDRWYDVDIRLGDTMLARQAIAGEFAAGSVADLMDILQGTFNVHVVRSGRVLTLFPR